MTRILLKVAYDGTDYSGWQVQPGAVTVEGRLNEALSNLTGTSIAVIGASRTDAGVHALGNAAVFDYEGTIPPERFSQALQQYLPKDIVVTKSCAVAADFHPRRTGTRKTYEYTYDNGAFPNPLMKRYSWHIRRPLDVERMNQAAQYLVGEHDFASFCCVRTQAESTVRTVYSIEAVPVAGILGNTVILRVTGNGFLYNMVRIIAGTLSQVGAGQWAAADVKAALEAKNRTTGGITAPPQGLKLVDIAFETLS